MIKNIHQILLIQIIFQVKNNLKNNGNIVVVIVEIFIVVDKIMELEIEIIIVVVVVVKIITINNIGEDHVVDIMMVLMVVDKDNIMKIIIEVEVVNEVDRILLIEVIVVVVIVVTNEVVVLVIMEMNIKNHLNIHKIMANNNNNNKFVQLHQINKNNK